MDYGNIQFETVESKRMSDLISKNEAIQRLIQETVDSKNSLIHINTIKRLLKDVDTVYDVDKVIEDIMEAYGCHSCEQADIMACNECAELEVLNDICEIVKQGGVGTETETIRDKAIKWNKNSSKRLPYEFIDYVEGRREIGVSDDVCDWKQDEDGYTNCRYTYDEIDSVDFFKFCPYCGKKIKVVE